MFNIVDDFGNNWDYFATEDMWRQTVFSMSAYGAIGAWVWNSETQNV